MSTPRAWRAAQRAAERFLAGVPSTAEVGQMEFARRPVLLQSPTTDHSLTLAAIAAAATGRRRYRDRRHDPDGAARADEAHAARRQAAAERDRAAVRRRLELRHRPAGGGAPGQDAAHPHLHDRARDAERDDPDQARRAQTVTTPVPVSPQELGQIASRLRRHAPSPPPTAPRPAPCTPISPPRSATRRSSASSPRASPAGAWCCCCSAACLSLRWFGRLI